MSIRYLVLFFLALRATALYEAPPGGCAGPTDDDAFISAPTQKVSGRQKIPPKATKHAPAATPPLSAQDMERQLYEQESAAALAGLGGEEPDWDEVERQHLRSIWVRKLLSGAAAVVGLCYALFKVNQHVKSTHGTANNGSPASDDAKAPPATDASAAAAIPSAAKATDTTAPSSPRAVNSEARAEEESKTTEKEVRPTAETGEGSQTETKAETNEGGSQETASEVEFRRRMVQRAKSNPSFKRLS